MKRLQSIVVWYTPSQRSTLTPGKAVILDPTLSAAFEIAAEAATPIDTAILSKKSKGYWKDNSHCRDQIFSQRGTMDIRTAEALAGFYHALESQDWKSLKQHLLPYMTCTVSPEVWQQGITTTRTATEFIAHTRLFRAPFGDSFYIDVTWAYIISNRALVEFSTWVDGVVINSVLTQYSFEIIDGVPMISSIYNHSNAKDDDVTASEDGTLQWTRLN